MDPSQNEIAAQFVPDNVSNQNMKRMKVNVQVTAVTTLLEAMGCLLVLCTWTLSAKFAGYGTLIPSMLLYLVLLPYAFLMNTTQNRHRIIEEGWINVLKNIFYIDRIQSLSVVNEMRNERRVKVFQRPSSSESVRVRPKNITQNDATGSANHPKQVSNKTDENEAFQIFTIFRNPIYNETQIPSAINVPIYDQPSSSKISADNHMEYGSSDSD